MKILVTGAAGFIGSRCAEDLAKRGDDVIGIDNINDYYDVNLKYSRLNRTGIRSNCNLFPVGYKIISDLYPNYSFIRLDISDGNKISQLFRQEEFDKVINLAAQAGVRYSITNPYAYLTSNLTGFLNILEGCRHNKIKHLVYASSSSVYGMNEKTPFNENDVVISPVSLYAATKKSDELLAYAYCNLYKIPCTGLRYFTVYGPYGRPDMVPMIFSSAMRCGEPIKVFNNGNMIRDFTYIDDIVNGTIQTLDIIPKKNKNFYNLQYDIYNIGCGHPVNLMDFIKLLEIKFNKKANIIFMPMQPGDVKVTYADTSKLAKGIGYKPIIELDEGIERFVGWYKTYYKCLT